METLTIRREEVTLAGIRQVFAEITRYPEEILDLEAHLEEDLGIDSVKLGEIYAVLKERYQLPEELVIPPEQLTSIQKVYEALKDHALAPAASVSAGVTNGVSINPEIPTTPAAGNGTAPAPQSDKPVAVSPVNNNTNSTAIGKKEVLRTVTEIFAEVTRYPEEILDPQANLEEDLGIDSVKLGEIYAILKERFGLSDDQTVAPEQLTSIAGVASAIAAFVEERPAGQAAEELPAGSNGVSSALSNGSITAPSPNGSKAVVSNGSAAASSPAQSSRPQSPYGDFFKDKKVFISGSGHGIGKDIAVYLAELGATVVVNSFHSRAKGEETCKEIKNKGHKAHHIWGSMANPEHVERVWDEVEEEMGSVNYFIHAASNGMLDKLENITPEHWKKAFQTNIVGLHQSALRALKLMKKHGGGRIITMSSPAAHGYVDYFGVMGTVKAAVESLTRSMAVEFEPYNVQVNCVSPGPVYGELLTKWPDSDRLVARWESNTVYNRLCEARDISKFIAYLLSDEAQLFNAGVLVQDGGISSRRW